MPGPRGGKKTIWKGKAWRETRAKLLKDHCEQCGSTKPPFVLQHVGLGGPTSRERQVGSRTMSTEDYVTGKGTKTFCKRCAFLWDMKGLRLCRECGKRFHAHRHQRCFECHQRGQQTTKASRQFKAMVLAKDAAEYAAADFRLQSWEWYARQAE